MQISAVFPALTLLILAGCDGGTTALETTQAPDTGSEESILTPFSGATFVAVGADQLNADLASGVGSVSFTDDTVTWTQSEIVMVDSVVLSQSDIVEIGSYVNDGSTDLVASFPDRDVVFRSDNGNLIWDSLSYRRADGSQFISQESLVAALDGSTFIANEQSDIVANQANTPILTTSIRFDDDQAFWTDSSGVVLIGAINFVDDSSFKINFINREVTVVALGRNELVIDAVLYEKDLTNQFDSQQALVEFLDGASFRSTGLQSLGETSPGISAVGHWFVDFSGDTFTWSYLDLAEAGTVSFIDNNRFSAVLSDRTLIIEVQGDDFIWDDVRYRKVIGE